MQFHWFAVDAYVGDAPAGCDDGPADRESSWKTDCLDRYIDAGPSRQFITRWAACPSVLLINVVAPKVLATARRLSSKSILKIAAGE